MNPFKYAQMMKYLTRAKKANPELPNVFPASKAPIPPKTQNVEEIEAINEFIKRNPRAEGGRIGFNKAGFVRSKGYRGYVSDERLKLEKKLPDRKSVV
mgnify:CR=1 FL=1